MKIIVQSKIQNVNSYCFNIELGVERVTSTFDSKLTFLILAQLNFSGPLENICKLWQHMKLLLKFNQALPNLTLPN